MSETLLAALPPDVRKACGLPDHFLNKFLVLAAQPRQNEKEKREHQPERHSLSAHQAAEPQNLVT
jgi:hypothetical protein